MMDFRPTKHLHDRFTHHKGVPKAYEVFVSGQMIGQVRQAERHSYKMAGRLRYGDTYAVKWQALLPNGEYARSHRVYADTRKEAASWLTNG